MSDCRPFETDLVAWRAGECSPSRAGEIDSHVSTCSACRAFVEDVDRVRGLLSRLPEIEPRPEAMARIAAAARRSVPAAAARRARSRSGAASRETVLSGVAIGFDFVRFQLGRRPSLRIVGAIAAALAIHALAFAALRGVRGPAAPGGVDAVRLGPSALPADRQDAVVIETLGDPGVGRSEPWEEGVDLRDPEVFGTYREAVARQTEIWNTRSRFRLDASVRLDPEARRRVFAAFGDPEGVENGIDSGLDYLSAASHASDREPGAGASPSERSALSALTALAFLGRGSSDSYGPHRDACAREVSRLLPLLDGGDGRASDPPDALTRALALWALAENSALSDSRRGADRIPGAIAAFELEQLEDGGWAKRAGDAASDPLTSAVVASALAIGARSGFAVTTGVAGAFAERLAFPELRDLPADSAGGVAVSSASLLLALELWRPLDPRMAPPESAVAAVERMLTAGVASGRSDLVLFERGLLALQLGSLPEGGRALHGTVARRLLEAQRPSGEIDPGRFEWAVPIGGRSPAVATALAVLILEIPCRYRSRI